MRGSFLIQIIKKILPWSVKQRLKSLPERFNIFCIRFFSKYGWLASVYFAFFSRQFDREHKALLVGRLAYHQALKQAHVSSALLRRNIHRLEKGLIMRPRKQVFAEAYISETVSMYALALNQPSFCKSELAWAFAVLERYFVVVEHTQPIAAAKMAFSQLPQTEKTNAVPYLQQELPENQVTFFQLYTLFTRRRSVRWYLQKAVPSSLLEQAIAAAALAPSACNRQPYQFIVLNDNAKAATAAACAMGTVGFAENIPCLVVVTGDLSAYPAERDRHVIYIDAALASMQLMLALETLGLSSCPINWPDIEEREQALSNMLNLPYHQRVVMLMAVGYADPEGGIAYSQKKPTSLLIKEDTTHVN